MAIYKTRWFDRWARKEGLTDAKLCTAVEEIAAGLYEADLGGGLIKKRIGRPGQGKRSGYRTLLATNLGTRWVFMYGFPKNERSNIDKDEEAALKLLAQQFLTMSAKDIKKAIAAEEVKEVKCNA